MHAQQRSQSIWLRCRCLAVHRPWLRGVWGIVLVTISLLPISASVAAGDARPPSSRGPPPLLQRAASTTAAGAASGTGVTAAPPLPPMPPQPPLHWEPITPDTGKCPSWLKEYAAFHKANRGQPGATYLVLYCPKDVKCLGLGDRITGLMVLLRLAALYKKVLLMVWDHPEPIRDYLHPTDINWTPVNLPEHVTDMLHDPTLTTPFDVSLVTYNYNQTWLASLVETGEHAAEFAAAPMIKMQFNLRFDLEIYGSRDGHFVWNHGRHHFGRCLFRFLFRPAPNLLKQAKDRLKELYGSKPHPFIAWHWRLGGQVSETVLHRTDHHPGKHEIEVSKMQTILSVLPCAEHLYMEAGGKPLTEKPMLMVTDHNIVRSFVAGGHMRDLVAMPARVVHVQSRKVTMESYHDTWLDLVMLSQADCIMFSSSGYSKVALWMSNATCAHHFALCVMSDEPRFHDAPVRRMALDGQAHLYSQHTGRVTGQGMQDEGPGPVPRQHLAGQHTAQPLHAQAARSGWVGPRSWWSARVRQLVKGMRRGGGL